MPPVHGSSFQYMSALWPVYWLANSGSTCSIVLRTTPIRASREYRASVLAPSCAYDTRSPESVGCPLLWSHSRSTGVSVHATQKPRWTSDRQNRVAVWNAVRDAGTYSISRIARIFSALNSGASPTLRNAGNEIATTKYSPVIVSACPPFWYVTVT